MRTVGAVPCFLALSVVLLVVACGNGDIGESCDEDGHVGGQCVSGAVCGHTNNPTDGPLVCLKQCNSPANCGANEDCTATGSDLRGCRPH